MDAELRAREPEHEPVTPDAADQVTRRAAAGVQPGRMPAIYLGHGAPPLVDDPLWGSAEALDAGDVDALANFTTAPAARYAHPTTEHFAPLFVTLGAADGPPAPVTTITGYWLGLAKRSFQVA